MNTGLHDLITRLFSAVEAKDLETAMSLFGDDALVIDPHFPAHRMRGKVAIAEGFRAAMGAMRSFGYTTLNYFETENGAGAAVETATHHVISEGTELNFSQVFVFEVADMQITRMQAYEPYGPHGMMGVFLILARLKSLFVKSGSGRPAPPEADG